MWEPRTLATNNVASQLCWRLARLVVSQIFWIFPNKVQSWACLEHFTDLRPVGLTLPWASQWPLLGSCMNLVPAQIWPFRMGLGEGRPYLWGDRLMQSRQPLRSSYHLSISLRLLCLEYPPKKKPQVPATREGRRCGRQCCIFEDYRKWFYVWAIKEGSGYREFCLWGWHVSLLARHGPGYEEYKVVLVSSHHLFIHVFIHAANIYWVLGNWCFYTPYGDKDEWHIVPALKNHKDSYRSLR